MQGTTLNMALGYSHPVDIVPPEGITISVEANTKITVKGSNKQTVGDVAALIRSKRKPEVYKGKGVKYEGEYIRRKAGKAGKNRALSRCDVRSRFAGAKRAGTEHNNIVVTNGAKAKRVEQSMIAQTMKVVVSERSERYKYLMSKICWQPRALCA